VNCNHAILVPVNFCNLVLHSFHDGEIVHHLTYFLYNTWSHFNMEAISQNIYHSLLLSHLTKYLNVMLQVGYTPVQL
jgi:hypothetical protein